MFPISSCRVLLLALSLAGCAARAPESASLPASADSARVRLAASTRHGEWVRIPIGGTDTVRAWVVYPERSTRAPVVVVVHEIHGLTTWVRGVTDQLAAEGFIAIAPDLLPGTRRPSEGGVDSAVARIEAAGRYGTRLPAAVERWGVVGFGWGGSIALATAAKAGSLGAAVSFYGGVSPDQASLSDAPAPTLVLLADDDAQVNRTIPFADSSYRAAGARFEPVSFAGAGHGFLRAQDERSGANRSAAREGWTRTLAWLRRHLGR